MSGDHDMSSAHTASNGCPVTSPPEAPSTGRHPLEDNSDLADKLSQFNREKTLERAVHARGGGAYGEFEVTHDISDICSIDMLLGVGKKTPCVTRFSTTTFERGSAEAMRDPKGMATKFFTNEGDWDWVCLNIPMFFIRDPAKFPDLMRAQRRDPESNLMNPNMWWDWVCKNHESLHMVLWLYSEFGTMFNYRSLSGYVGHAYKWVMPDGSWKYVHFFLASDRGPNFAQGESVGNVSPTDQDSATRDLYEAIERGEYPTWTANVQVVDPEDAHKLAFNILDLTKHWNLGNYPSDIAVIPSRPVGKLTLNRNPHNFLTEIEQLAFSPSNLVPGVEPSEDPVLLARMFAYPDAQTYRLGRNNKPSRVNNAESTMDNSLGPERSVTDHQPRTMNAPKRPGSSEFDAWVASTLSQSWSQPNEQDYKYPRAFWEVLPTLRSPEFQNTIVVNTAQSLVEARKDIRERVYATLALVADDLSERVRHAAEKLIVEREVTTRGKLEPPRL
ncbi:putative catalase Cat [Xylaria nigripes]|nr:putative catalase Cat [Xylaria nigripes]